MGTFNVEYAEMRRKETIQVAFVRKQGEETANSNEFATVAQVVTVQAEETEDEHVPQVRAAPDSILPEDLDEG